MATETPEEAEALIQEYPWLEEIYEEIAMLRQNPEEVLGLFSEALRILDRNTVKYMIEELKKDVEEKNTVIEEKDTVIKGLEAEIAELKRQLKELN